MGEPALKLLNPEIASTVQSTPAAAKGMARALDLALIPEVLRPHAQEAFRAGDAGGLLCLMDSTAGLGFVFDNVWALAERGILEEALVDAYISTRVNFSGWSKGALDFLFDRADRGKLRAAGDPIPEGQTFTLYRGVAGAKGRRRVRGLSWTRDLDGAAWFACRLMLPDPAVYVTTATPTDVYFYSHERQEDDFVLRVGSVRRLRMTPDDLKARAERRAAAIRVADEKFYQPPSKIIDRSAGAEAQAESAPRGGKAK